MARGVKIKVDLSASSRRRVEVQLSEWVRDRIRELPPERGVIEFAFQFRKAEDEDGRT